MRPRVTTPHTALAAKPRAPAGRLRNGFPCAAGHASAIAMATSEGGQAGDAAPDLEVTASHQALSVVAGWLGMSAEDALEETGAAADALFDKPRPNL